MECLSQSNINPAETTLLWHIEKIIYAAEDCELSNDFFSANKVHLDFISDMLQITTFQALLFALFINVSDYKNIGLLDISKYLKCKRISLMNHLSDFEELENRKFVRCCRVESPVTYRVPKEVVDAVNQNKLFVPRSTTNLSAIEIFDMLDNIFKLREDKEISYESMKFELEDIIVNNLHLTFCKEVKKYIDETNDFILLILFCHLFINNDDDSVGFHDFTEIFESKNDLRSIKDKLILKYSDLIVNGWIESVFVSGFENREFFHLTKKAKEELLSDFKITVKKSVNCNDLIGSASITAKKLIYNPRERDQVDTLTSLLQPDNFITVQKKLTDNNMRKGFACLFYGPPGTGKTETVYQISRLTGRNILMVDISQVKSMWFGESEKNIKEIFDKYKTMVKNEPITPILLFNEADAVIGKRKDSVSSSVAQTENAIQNIILQEMENMEGIMIATTNLTQNLDKAFDRRFLYKIEFEKPSALARREIWKVMIPPICDSDAEVLSQIYDFSGGQIENIARKRLVESILRGTEPSLGTLHSICQSEILTKSNTSGKIGYRGTGTGGA